MKYINVTWIFLFLLGCYEPIPLPALPKSGYHLESITVYWSTKTFSQGDKVLDIDTVSKTVEISGSSSAFHSNGTFNYRIYDSVIAKYIPTQSRYINDTVSLIQIGNMSGDLIYNRNFDSTELLIYADYNRGTADEEDFFRFVKK